MKFFFFHILSRDSAAWLAGCGPRCFLLLSRWVLILFSAISLHTLIPHFSKTRHFRIMLWWLLLQWLPVLCPLGSHCPLCWNLVWLHCFTVASLFFYEPEKIHCQCEESPNLPETCLFKNLIKGRAINKLLGAKPSLDLGIISFLWHAMSLWRSTQCSETLFWVSGQNLHLWEFLEWCAHKWAGHWFQVPCNCCYNVIYVIKSSFLKDHSSSTSMRSCLISFPVWNAKPDLLGTLEPEYIFQGLFKYNRIICGYSHFYFF